MVAASCEHSVLAEPFVAMLRQPALFARQTLADWDRTLRLARATNLMGRIACDLKAQGLMQEVPAPVLQHLVAADRLVSHQQAGTVREARFIAQALSELDIPVVLLKGAAYALAGRTAARGRLFGDVDILVPRGALNAVEAALMKHGWAVGRIDPYDSRYYRQWMHELPPMAHLQRGTVIDVHHNILPLTIRYAPDASLLLRDSQPVSDSSLRVLAPADMVIHSAVHLFHEGELRNGLRDLLDLHALLDEFASQVPSFWTCLTTRAVELDLVWPLHLALRYASQVLLAPVPVQVLDEMARLSGIGRARQRVLDAVYLRAFLPDHPLAISTSVAVARLVLYVRAHALRMPPLRLLAHLGRKALMRTVKHSSRQAP